MSRLLLVERSATMRHVLGEHLRGLGHDVDDADDPARAVELLDSRFADFADEYAAVVFGWPALTDDESAARLAERLERDDLRDLPVVVMSTDLRSATRAWVAGRARTSMLAWKRFAETGTTLEHLLDRDESPGKTASKFDNADIRLLVIDDSATIRRSLHDLFSLHGYRILLAANREQALVAARSEHIDIAIIDFYLGDDTGDRICRELVGNADTGHIVCAMLTGSYSDHIIRSSLRAGALECMFKNESHELLLSRIDALARFVRQRRRLALERRLLDRVVDIVAGAALVLDADDRLRHVGREALERLGHDDAEALIGHPAAIVVDPLPPLPPPLSPLSPPLPTPPTRNSSAMRVTRTAQPGAAPSIAVHVRHATGRQMAARAERIDLGGGLGSVLLFELDASAAVRRPVSTVRARIPLPASAVEFEALVTRCLDGREEIEREASLLVLRVWHPAEATEPARIVDSPRLAGLLERQLAAIYRREHHVASLADGCYGFLIRHVDLPQSWLLTRKILQLVDECLLAEGGPRLATTASLKNLAGEPADVDRLFARCFDALELVESRGLDRALLLDPRRMLPVWPAVDGDR